ncbi:RlpA-like double-psi beta-barrel domain-containing protein [Stomatohabitans albus]|uniref:RlpA-like double-psi beta-barrel domain-containing protein n=1 Tax=Stomatohabitans albus TaxID=3110766 RepID=UPI00300D8AAB
MATSDRLLFKYGPLPLALVALIGGGAVTSIALSFTQSKADPLPAPSLYAKVQATRDPQEFLPKEDNLPPVSPVKPEDHNQTLNDRVPEDLPKAVEVVPSEVPIEVPKISVAELPESLRPKNAPVPEPPAANPGTAPYAGGSQYSTPTLAPPGAQLAPQLPANAPVNVTHILPPSQGMMRINPLKLPPVPTGTLMEGLASWYGAEEHGTTTACMVTYDMYAPTLATRELPCGTPVLIVAKNGRMATATTTDWGPAEWTKRRFDLSPVVFEQLGNLSSGVIDVQVITLDQPKKLGR